MAGGPTPVSAHSTDKDRHNCMTMPFYEGKTVLVTGATGLIGANLTEALLSSGASIRATINETAPVVVDDRIEYITADLREEADCKRVVDQVDILFHCAADTSGAAVMVNNPMAQITGNVLMNTRLMEAAVLAEVSNFLFVSSSAVYPPGEHDFKEDEGFDGDPFDTYFGVAWMKRYAEKLLTFYHRRYGMNATIIRPSNVYGPLDKFDPERSHVLPALIRRVDSGENPLKVWGSGQEVRDFIYVDDFVRVIIKAVETCADAEPLNVPSGRLTTIAECAQIIVDQGGHTETKLAFDPSKPTTIPYRALAGDGVASRVGDTERVPLEEGLRRTIEWYRANS